MPEKKKRKKQPREPRLNLYGKGIQMTASGHLRYTSPKELRNKYVHRVVIDKLLEETPDWVKCYLPYPYEVHHMDYHKPHNCPYNLLLLPEAMHSAITADRARDDGGRFGRKFIPRWKPAPQYVLDLIDDKEVPF